MNSIEVFLFLTLFALLLSFFFPLGNWQERARDLGKMEMRHVFKR